MFKPTLNVVQVFKCLLLLTLIKLTLFGPSFANLGCLAQNGLLQLLAPPIGGAKSEQKWHGGAKSEQNMAFVI